MDELYQELKKYGQVKANESLKKHTTFKIGGLARFFVIVDDVKKATTLFTYLSATGVKFLVMGGGSNLLFADEGYDGVVVKLTVKEARVEGNNLRVAAGASLATVVNLATTNHLSGLEWAVGIPGTVGGAVCGNAGAMGDCLSYYITEITVWQDGESRQLAPEECGFGYRASAFQKNGAIILTAVLRLNPTEPAIITARIQENIIARQKYSSLPSAGSFFKNIKLMDYPGDKTALPELFITRGMIPAGWLIDECGLRGYRIGDAGVSAEHGNFLVNYGSATRAEVLQVVAEISQKVYNKFGVELAPEVRIV